MSEYPNVLEYGAAGALVIATLLYVRGKFNAEAKRDEVEGTLDERVVAQVAAGQLREKALQDQLFASEQRNVALQLQLGEVHKNFSDFAISTTARFSSEMTQIREGLHARMEELKDAHSVALNKIAEEHRDCKQELALLRMAMNQAGIKIPTII